MKVIRVICAVGVFVIVPAIIILSLIIYVGFMTPPERLMPENGIW